MKTPQEKEELPSLFFSYVSPLLRKGYERPITEKDLLSLPEGAEADAHGAGFLNRWSKERSDGEASPVASALNGIFAAEKRRIAIVASIHIVFAVATPVLLNQLFAALEGSRQFSQSESLWLAAGLFLSTLAYGLANEQIFHLPRVLALKVHGCVISAIGQLSVSSASSVSSNGEEPKDNGHIVNLVTNDCWRLFELYVQRHRLWAVPIQIALLLPLLIYYLGPAALIGIVLLFAISPLSRLLIARIAVIRQDLLSCSDSRLSLIKKALDHIRSIKLGYKEQQVIDRILQLRRRESRLLSSRIWQSTLLNLIVVGSGTLVAAVSIIVYTLLGNELTTSAVFTAIAMFNLLQMPVAQLSDVYRVHSESSKSLTRIDEFLAKANASPRSTRSSWRDLGLPDRGLVTVISGTDQCSDVVGLLSDLIASLMDEEGSEKPKIASVGINDWLFHGTIRHNIILAKDFDQQRYELVIDQVCLREDLETLAKGDQTVLSSNGANLSGGQRQRVNLARALYSRPKILVLNEPLRGLDEGVRGRILQHLLSPKVSSVLSQCLIIVSENSFDLATYASHHLTLLEDKAKVVVNDQQKRFAAEASPPAICHDNKTADARPSQTEVLVDKPRTGSIDPTVVRRYLGAIGFAGAALILVFFAIKEAADLFGNFSLAAHSSTNSAKEGLLASFEFLPTYIASILTVLAAIALRSLLLGHYTLRASSSFFTNTINQVFKASPQFFWQTPASVILNRLSKDVDSLDQSLPQILSGLLLCLFTTLGILVAIGVTAAEVLLLVVPLLVFYGYCQRYFRRTAREAKRLFASTRTPFLNALTELLDGGLIARLYGSSEMLLGSYKASLDIHQRALHSMLIINRWLGSRLVVISAMLIGGLSFAAVSQSATGDSGWWGVAFAYSFSLTNVLTWGVQAISDAEAEFSAVERLTDLSDSAESTHPPEALVTEEGRMGFLKIEDFHFRFAKDQPKLFYGLELAIPSAQKLGIVGRTGSGKSTLVYALAGLLSAEHGKVSLDGLNMNRMNYSQLRAQVAVVPQEHESMFGSVRQNIDPTGKASDQDILAILTELWGGPFDAKQLDVDVADLNSQQALAVALTTELIKGPKVLILDEVTALTDQEQDAALYHTIWRLANKPTLIVISHNLSGLAQMDRIVVLSKGKITYDGAYHAGLAESLT